jgi:DNA helicase II / ATP-dependent DNA helicase PcrA
MSKMIESLNDKQREAVLQTEGPVLILAGAGSGKTRALTFRVAYLILEKGVHPKNVLAVTFTNKAAGEMLERVKELLKLPPETTVFSSSVPHVGTFHSICVRILRREIERIGFESKFVIYDDQDQLALMKRVMREMQVSQDQIKPKAVLAAISSAKNKLIDAQSFEEQTGSYFEELVAKCYTKYAKELKQASALDFDDIILFTVKLMQENPDILEKYQTMFRYIMVDEYQDTNHAQYTLLRMLADKHKNLCVVGDDWQSIYGWRGADVQNILDFEKDYPDAKVILLEQNYRSTQNILDAAHQVISQNVNRKEKNMWTENESGNLLTLFEARDEKTEAKFVTEEIEKLKKEMKLKFDDFAVLYRTNAQSRAMEEAFMKAGIPYKIIGGMKFYQRKEVKDILAYLFFVHNPSNKIGFERIINIPTRGIGDKTIEKIIKIADELGGDLLLAIEKIAKAKDSREFGIPASKAKELQKFYKLMGESLLASQTETVAELIARIYRSSGYEKMLANEGEEGQVRHENVQELLTVARKFDKHEDGLEAFLEEVTLVSQTDNDLGVTEVVPFMTLHSAKGLEYESIFIVGMEEGLLPHSRATMNESEMEEERRLCYVGITRAKQKAHLLYTMTRNIYGSTQMSVKSRFIDEIKPELFEQRYDELLADDDFFRSESVIDRGLDDFFEDKQGFIKRPTSFDLRPKKKSVEKKRSDFRDGESVQHTDFGRGIIVSQDEKTFSVVFPKAGLKKLAKGIAPLEKV